MEDYRSKLEERKRIVAEENKQRGYSKGDMERIKKELERRHGSWCHKFDEYVALLLHDDSSNLDMIINKSIELANKRQQILESREDRLLLDSLQVEADSEE